MLIPRILTLAVVPRNLAWIPLSGARGELDRYLWWIGEVSLRLFCRAWRNKKLCSFNTTHIHWFRDIFWCTRSVIITLVNAIYIEQHKHGFAILAGCGRTTSEHVTWKVGLWIHRRAKYFVLSHKPHHNRSKVLTLSQRRRQEYIVMTIYLNNEWKDLTMY